MAIAVDGGIDMITALGSARPSQEAMDYFARENQALVTRAQQLVGTAAHQIYAYTNQVYNNIVNSRVWDVAESLVKKAKHTFDDNCIRQLTTLEGIQYAKPVMQRFIMACPALRGRYQRQEIDGYSESYIDHQPGTIGEQHYDYRRVMNGILTMTENDDNEDGWVITNYAEELFESDRELTFSERNDVLVSWSTVERLLETQKYDPTSVFKSLL